jgi:serine/threonine protein phosphatase PrpC
MLTLNWGSATDVGLVRQLNQDSLWASSTLFAVADGMGGHAAGEIASELAIAECGRIAELSPLRAEDISAAIRRANEQILSGAAARRDRFDMGTTLTGLGVVTADGGPHWAVFNVGDSRVYRFAGGMLSQLTVDHSEVQELIAAGELRPQDARFYPRRNVVTRSLGSDPPPDADIWVFPPVTAERFLICSDGLTGEVPDAEIAHVLHETPDPHDAAAELVHRANEAGGHDNISTVVVDVIATGVGDA